MQTNYISIQGDENQGWDVVKRFFPVITEGRAIAQVGTTPMRAHYIDKAAS